MGDPQRIRRARPLLGTFVEIELRAAEGEAVLHRACTSAFTVIEEIDRLMSFHRADSDLSRLNRTPMGRWTSVDPRTARVLQVSNELFVSSGGVFDIRCGSTLANWGLLPGKGKTWRAPKRRALAPPVDVQGTRVRRRSEAWLDLGGIAKGFAVDQAVDHLQQRGILSGLVNAGGDLRSFGAEPWEVAVRLPTTAPALSRSIRLKETALASSSVCFSRRRTRRGWVSALVDARTHRPFLSQQSASVLSDTCLLADALTKIVLLAPSQAPAILSRYQSSAFVLDGQGRIDVMN